MGEECPPAGPTDKKLSLDAYTWVVNYRVDYGPGPDSTDQAKVTFKHKYPGTRPDQATLDWMGATVDKPASLDVTLSVALGGTPMTSTRTVPLSNGVYAVRVRELAGDLIA
ncbi:MAG: hypothetical protein K2W96_01625, partial [Gemmataceae bacterium]|nr:hypothetical protein [Gemmataceae bacterium]